MITYEEALRVLMERVRPLREETVPLDNALGRVLARDVVCDVDMPPFDKSAMDGYACRREDLPGPLRVVEVIAAGAPPTVAIAPGECAKIMTGAMTPDGADCVVMVEHTRPTEDGNIEYTREETAANICYRGEDVRAGDVVLRRGTLLGARHVAVLAMAGCAAPVVACQPRVGVMATGDELVAPHTVPRTSQIRNSNSAQLRAQLTRMNAVVTDYGIVPDTREALDNALQRASMDNDVVLLSGGVSMGDFDLAPEAMKRAGFDIVFDSIAVQPGKPTTFAVSPDAYCFGLPGNPVSTFVQCEMLVKPFLYALAGHTFMPPVTTARLAERYRRKKAERAAWVPVTLNEEGAACFIDYHGSAHILALCNASGFLFVPPGVSDIPAESLVTLRLIIE